MIIFIMIWPLRNPWKTLLAYELKTMLMSSEKELGIILKRWEIKYSIQLTFIECLLWACC